MLSSPARLLVPLAVLLLALPCAVLGAPGPLGSGQAANLLANPGFEWGKEGWRLDVAGKSDARFAVDDSDACADKHSALLSVGRVEEWGAQFGQVIDAGTPGKTYTFAVMAKSVGGKTAVDLQIERTAKPWDRVARSGRVSLEEGKWTELHVTFKLDKPFPPGWFAYLSCAQANSACRVDAFRLYEGDYVPFKAHRRQRAPAALVRLFDTGKASPVPLSTEIVSNRSGWSGVAEDQTEHRFRGDAVLSNNRLVVVLRPGAPGAEMYGTGPSGPILRAVLAPACGEPKLQLASLKIVENTPAAVILDAAFKTSGGKTALLRYELEIGRAFVKTEAIEGISALRVEAPCRFLVLPDFFADDMVVDASEVSASTAQVPSENFLLHMLPGAESIVMSVSQSSEEDARIGLSGQSAQRMITHSEIPYGKKGRVWVAAIDGAHVWHKHEVGERDRGKIIPLDWKTPYPAQWRVDWRRADRLTGSWEMITQKPDGTFVKHGWFGNPQTVPRDRKRWTTVLGRFEYPCWVDGQGRAHLQPFTRKVRFQGPALIYPINRVRQTPLTVLTVVDLVRATLGVGPCEYILDVEGQATTRKGRATCATRDLLNPIYAAGRQKHERATIERALDDVLTFVRHIRGRIETYRDFGHEMLGYLQQQKKAHPELSEFLAEMETLTRAIDERFEQRREKIRTPQYIAGLTEKFRTTLLDYEGQDALARCKVITKAFTTVGGNQDELVGECRMAVKVLRQRAGMAMSADQRVAEVAKEIRRRTHEVLRNPASYESPRH